VPINPKSFGTRNENLAVKILENEKYGIINMKNILPKNKRNRAMKIIQNEKTGLIRPGEKFTIQTTLTASSNLTNKNAWSYLYFYYAI
jgi:hypothetical protein